ncbi:hypothetical protein N9Q42_00755 [bacterium]|nr:hypothetical protein [bacterium]
MKIILSALLLIAPSFSWAENYLCIPDQATGFSKQDGKYEISEFAANKIIVTTETKTLTAFGGGVLDRNCDITSVKVSCSSTSVDFNMHRDNLRFMMYLKSYGYVWGTSDNTYISIGTCSEF